MLQGSDSRNPVAESDLVASEPIPESVQEVLNSRNLEKAPTLRRLLLYLWIHRNEPLNEYAIAIDALGRPADFNPKIDATVRVHISRLRQRLERYYEEEGRATKGKLTIPMGSHQLVLDEATPASEETQPALAEPAVAVPAGAPPRSFWSKPTLFFAALSAVLFIGLALLLWGPESVRSTAGTSAPKPARFWKSFFSNGRKTRLILPTPIFYSWTIPGHVPRETIMFRDTNVNDFSSTPLSDSIAHLAAKYGSPSLAQSYTVTSDTFAAIHLARSLDHNGYECSVMSAAMSPMDALERENVIALGTWGTLNPLRPYQEQMNFELAPHEDFVVNRHPRGSEQPVYREVTESATRAIHPGIIALLPGRDRQTKLLLLASRHTAALVSFLTSHASLEQLDRMWRQNGEPDYFEVLIASEVDNTDLVKTWPMLLRAFPAK